MNQHAGLNVTVSPTVEPITLAEAKKFLRIDADDQDDVVQMCITVARERIENDTARALPTQTLRLTLDRFPVATYNGQLQSNYLREQVFIQSVGSIGTAIILPRPPLQSVTSVSYIDGSGTTQTLSASAYTVDTASEPGRIVPAYGTSWPTTQAVPNAVTVTYVAGFTTTTIPESAKLLCRLLVGEFYEHRDLKADLPLAIESLMWQLRWGHYA